MLGRTLSCFLILLQHKSPFSPPLRYLDHLACPCLDSFYMHMFPYSFLPAAFSLCLFHVELGLWALIFRS